MAKTQIVNILQSSEKKENVYGKVTLVQLGRLKCSGDDVVGRHTHLNWFEITCIVEGEGIIYAGDEKTNVKKGDVFLSFPCEAHKIVSFSANPLTFDHFAFCVNEQTYSERLERVMASHANPKERSFRSFLIRELVDGCINEIVADSELKRDYLESSFSLILFELLKIFNVKNGSMLIYETENPEKMCLGIKNYIDTHLFSLDSLSHLSTVCGYNYSYLSSLFKKVTGITISDYYNERRFESARLMIRENRLKVSEISNLLGYNSVYAFSKAFKDKFGTSPKNYYKKDSAQK